MITSRRSKMPNVLIPTNDQTIIPDLVEGYHKLGFEVVTGAANFFLRAHSFDLVHILWPEELTGWKSPTQAQLEEIREVAEWWVARTPLMISVNNLYPHGREGEEASKALYEIFYTNCDLILHHCEASRQLVNAEFPISARQRNIVTTMFGYHRHLPLRFDRDSARRSFGFVPDEFVLLVFGALRNRNEIKLLQSAFGAARVPHKRLLMAGRYVESLGRWERRWRNYLWSHWLRQQGAVAVTDFIPDEQVHRYFEAADAVIVPRLCDLSSGVIGMGMTFGTLVIAPDHGTFPDYISGTSNLLYKSGNAQSMAEAIEAATQIDRIVAGQESREKATDWTWERILRTALADWPEMARFGRELATV